MSDMQYSSRRMQNAMGEMTNVYEILVANFQDKEFTWGDNMKMDSRQTWGMEVLTAMGSSGRRFNRRLL
jgi:hypothetical protein